MSRQKVKKGMNWSQEMADKAAREHKYIKIGPKSGTLYLSGAPKRWEDPEYRNLLYIPYPLRIVGQPQNINKLFNMMQLNENQRQMYLNTAYTSNNYNTSKKQQFERELEELNAYKEANKRAKKNTKFTLDDLDQLVGSLKNAEKQKRASKGKKTKRGKRKVKGKRSPKEVTRRGKNLSDRLVSLMNENQRLPSNKKAKVLDVSKMNPETMTGIKKIDAVGPTSKKVGVQGVPIVSSVPEYYSMALRNVKDVVPNYKDFIEAYNQQYREKQEGNQPKIIESPNPTQNITNIAASPQQRTQAFPPVQQISPPQQTFQQLPPQNFRRSPVQRLSPTRNNQQNFRQFSPTRSPTRRSPTIAQLPSPNSNVNTNAMSNIPGFQTIGSPSSPTMN